MWIIVFRFCSLYLFWYTIMAIWFESIISCKILKPYISSLIVSILLSIFVHLIFNVIIFKGSQWIFHVFMEDHIFKNEDSNNLIFWDTNICMTHFIKFKWVIWIKDESRNPLREEPNELRFSLFPPLSYFWGK